MIHLSSSSVLTATLYVIFLTTASLQSLEFAFKKGVPTTIVVNKPYVSANRSFESITATLSDKTGHTETIVSCKIATNNPGLYSYYADRINALNGERILLCNEPAVTMFNYLLSQPKTQKPQVNKEH